MPTDRGSLIDAVSTGVEKGEQVRDAKPASDLTVILAESGQPASLSAATWLTWLLAGLVAGVYGLNLRLAYRLNVNWDEFHYLSYVYEAAHGTLVYRWATFHVHLFGWLRELKGGEIEQVLAARLALQVLAAGTGALIFRVARRFAGRDAALATVLAYASFTFVQQHGASFRPDPLCAFLVVLAVDLLLPPRSEKLAIVAGAALAISVMISLKAWFHVGLAAGLLAILHLYSSSARRQIAKRAAAFGIGFFGALVPLFVYHGRIVVAPSVGGQGRFLWTTVVKVFGGGRLLPGYAFFAESVRENQATWLTLGAGLLIVAWRTAAHRGAERGRQLVLLLFAAPLSAFFVYRNAFPYFYVFVLPLAVVLCGVVVEALLESSRRGSATVWRGVVVVLVITFASSAFAFFWHNNVDQMSGERQLLHVIHRVFPQPVAYIDRCSMVSSFPKVGFFMSTWGMQRYREAARPVMRDLLRENRVGFLIANALNLRLDRPRDSLVRGPFALLPEDVDVLRDNFLPHWGALYVQGKSFTFSEEEKSRRFEILSPGQYTVEAQGAVRLDGQRRVAGDVVDLTSGWHEIEAENGVESARLRWGARLLTPAFPPLRVPIFTGL